MTKVIALVAVQTLAAKAEFHADGRLLKAAQVETHQPGTLFDLAKSDVDAMILAGHVRLPNDGQRPSKAKTDPSAEKAAAEIAAAEKALEEAKALLAASGDDLVAKGEAEAMVTVAEAALVTLKP